MLRFQHPTFLKPVLGRFRTLPKSRELVNLTTFAYSAENFPPKVKAGL